MHKFNYYMPIAHRCLGHSPQKGLVEIKELDPREPIVGVGAAYALLTYDRPLTLEEVLDYELMADTDQQRRNEEVYKGFTIRFNPLLCEYDVWYGTTFVASTKTIEEAKTGIDGI